MQKNRMRRAAALAALMIAALMSTTVSGTGLAGVPASAESPPEFDPLPRGAAGVDGEIARMYLALLGRQPEAEGLEYWVSRRSNGMALTEMVAFFRTSPEFQQTFGTMVNASTDEWVEFMYLEVLERPAEAEGKAFWIERVDSGLATKEDLIIFFADSVEFRVKTTTGMEGLLALVDESEAAYGEFSDYRYTRSSYYLEGSLTTTLTVENGVVVKREHESTSLASTEEWVEVGDEVGTNTDSYPALTMPELHEACREHLETLDPIQHELAVVVDADGLMTRCGGFYEVYIADAGDGDFIEVSDFEVLDS